MHGTMLDGTIANSLLHFIQTAAEIPVPLDLAGKIAMIGPPRQSILGRVPFGENPMSRSTSPALKTRGSFATVAAFLFGLPAGFGPLPNSVFIRASVVGALTVTLWKKSWELSVAPTVIAAGAVPGE